jgi:hypothetical protein
MLPTDDKYDAAEEKIRAAMAAHGCAGDEFLYLTLRCRLWFDFEHGGDLLFVAPPRPRAISLMEAAVARSVDPPRIVSLDEGLRAWFSDENTEVQALRAQLAQMEDARERHLAGIVAAEEERKLRAARAIVDARRVKWNALPRDVRAMRRWAIRSPGAPITPAAFADALEAEGENSDPPEGWT